MNNKVVVFDAIMGAKVVELDEKDSLKTLQKLVGGYIEHVPTAMWGGVHPYLDKYDVWVNEEGIMQELPISIILNPDGKGANSAGVLLGNVVVTSSNEEGDTIGVDPADIEGIIAELKSLSARKMYAAERTIDITNVEWDDDYGGILCQAIIGGAKMYNLGQQFLRGEDGEYYTNADCWQTLWSGNTELNGNNIFPNNIMPEELFNAIIKAAIHVLESEY